MCLLVVLSRIKTRFACVPGKLGHFSEERALWTWRVLWEWPVLVNSRLSGLGERGFPDLTAPSRHDVSPHPFLRIAEQRKIIAWLCFYHTPLGALPNQTRKTKSASCLRDFSYLYSLQLQTLLPKWFGFGCSCHSFPHFFWVSWGQVGAWRWEAPSLLK